MSINNFKFYHSVIHPFKSASTISFCSFVTLCDAGITVSPPASIAPHIPNVPYVKIEWSAELSSARSTPEISLLSLLAGPRSFLFQTYNF